MRVRCGNSWESTEDGRARVVRCKHFTAPGLSCCKVCAEHLVQQGEAHELRCPSCGELGDFSHLAHEVPAAELEETFVTCANCGVRCYVLEALLVVRLELQP